jgi:hypothetical protein
VGIRCLESGVASPRWGGLLIVASRVPRALPGRHRPSRRDRRCQGSWFVRFGRDPVRGPLRAGEEDRHPVIIRCRAGPGSVPRIAPLPANSTTSATAISAAPAGVSRRRLAPGIGGVVEAKCRRSDSAVRVGQAATLRSATDCCWQGERTPSDADRAHRTPLVRQWEQNCQRNLGGVAVMLLISFPISCLGKSEPPSRPFRFAGERQ